ncbi:hypothetical protein KC319_g67 [Hortaea werneckii]|nr:hypothetical protein KC319_g67 [Hortaea werneckii]
MIESERLSHCRNAYLILHYSQEWSPLYCLLQTIPSWHPRRRELRKLRRPAFSSSPAQIIACRPYKREASTWAHGSLWARQKALRTQTSFESYQRTHAAGQFCIVSALGNSHHGLIAEGDVHSKLPHKLLSCPAYPSSSSSELRLARFVSRSITLIFIAEAGSRRYSKGMTDLGSHLWNYWKALLTTLSPPAQRFMNNSLKTCRKLSPCMSLPLQYP